MRQVRTTASAKSNPSFLAILAIPLSENEWYQQHFFSFFGHNELAGKMNATMR